MKKLLATAAVLAAFTLPAVAIEVSDADKGAAKAMIFHEYCAAIPLPAQRFLGAYLETRFEQVKAEVDASMEMLSDMGMPKKDALQLWCTLNRRNVTEQMSKIR